MFKKSCSMFEKNIAMNLKKHWEEKINLLA